MSTRRDFLQLSALTTLSATVIPELVRASNEHVSRPALADARTILFQGDSITDAGRNRANYYANDTSGMGRGYVHDIVTHLLGNHHDKGYRFYNRGVSGHKVFQLARRWDDDCLNLRPDLLSLLIGVNDYWHTIGGSYEGTPDEYEAGLRELLQRTLEALPDIRMIIGEPFAVAGGTAVDERWADFVAYRVAARNVAEDFGAVFIPYHGIFEEALAAAPASYWCPDGVHPSMAGNFLMKAAWIAGFEESQ